MRIIIKVTLLVFTSWLITSCAVKNLQNEQGKENPNVVKAKELLDQMAMAHGAANLKKFDTYQVKMTDEFYGFIGKSGSPFGGEMAATIDFIPGQFTARAKFTEGKTKGETLGIHNWQTYTVNNDKTVELKKNKAMKFWLPAYQYFIEFPAQILKADALSYQGTAKEEGKEYDLVLASWKSTEPQKDIDQYVVWLDKTDHKIFRLDYTIRDINKWVWGTAYYKNYINIDGVVFPTYVPVKSDLKKKGWLHEMKIQSIEKNKVSRTELEVE